MTPLARLGVLSLVVALAPVASGCSQHLYSPPARMLPLESPAVLPAGRVGVALEAAMHGELFGPDLSSYTLRGRTGLDIPVDLSAEAHVVHVHEPSSADVHRNGYVLRLGAKYGEPRHLALVGGLGGGGSAAGGFVSPDLGVLLAFENEYFVPFGGVRGFVSLPVGAREVDLSTDGEAPNTVLQTPTFSYGFAWQIGFRVPIGDPRADEVSVSLAASLGMTHIWDEEERGNFVAVGAGLEVVP